MTTLSIFSDIHANLSAMKAVRGAIEASRTDFVYCLGDIGGYASCPNESQQEVISMGCQTVMGNYDESVGNNLQDCGCHYIKPFDIEMSNTSFMWTREHTSEENKKWLRSLPKEIRFEIEGKRVLLCHGSPRSTTEYLFETRSDGYLKQFTAGGSSDAQADIIIFGHTHVPYHSTVDGTHFINTGSVGRPKDGDPRAGYCVVTITGSTVSVEQVRVPYDIDETVKGIREAGLPEYFAQYLQTGGRVTGHE